MRMSVKKSFLTLTHLCTLISHVIIKPYMKYNMTCTHVHLDCEVTTGDLDMY